MKRGLFSLAVYCALTTSAFALGIRTFVAVPVAEGDWVFRALNINNFDARSNQMAFSGVYGFTNKHTIFITQPIRIHPRGANRTGDLSLLYRYTAYQSDRENGTLRLGLLGGGLIATSSNSDGGIQAGTVLTYFHNRSQIDTDVLYKLGLGISPDTARYDISWQYRIYPAKYDDDGDLKYSWNTVLEYNGRWAQSSNLVHQLTAGLQWVSSQLILEAGVVQDLNALHHTSLITSIRLHA